MAAEQVRTRRPGVPLGRVLGIPVYLAPSWLVAGVLVTTGLAPFLSYPHTPRPEHYAWAAAGAVLLAASILAHELGHSVVSLAIGIPIRRITLFLFGGIAEIEREPATAGAEYLVAVAGPLVSLFLSGVGFVVLRTTGHEGVVRGLAAYLAASNGLVAFLNLLPGLPLDGGRILRALVWGLTGDRDRGTRAAARGGQGIALLVGGAGVVEVGAGRYAGLFLLLIAAFIWANATAIGRRTELLRRLAGVTARSLARPVVRVATSLPLSEGLRRAVETGRRLLVVDSYGVPTAVLSGSALAAVPEHRRPWVTMADVSRALEPGLVLDARLAGEALLAAMRRTPASDYLVMDHDRVAGVLAAQDLAAVLEGRTA